MSWIFGHVACGTLAPQPGIEPIPPALEGKVLTTGQPGKSQICFFRFHFSVGRAMVAGVCSACAPKVPQETGSHLPLALLWGSRSPGLASAGVQPVASGQPLLRSRPPTSCGHRALRPQDPWLRPPGSEAFLAWKASWVCWHQPRVEEDWPGCWEHTWKWMKSMKKKEKKNSSARHALISHCSSLGICELERKRWPGRHFLNTDEEKEAGEAGIGQEDSKGRALLPNRVILRNRCDDRSLTTRNFKTKQKAVITASPARGSLESRALPLTARNQADTFTLQQCPNIVSVTDSRSHAFLRLENFPHV